ncbi:hypothetical protein [Streptomyces bluensis]|uniref:Uncharacterized protein n=1 Tax=Streptomyces bluensis TaxID=33897 RepID=A0ABW6UUY9_9ACTN
MARQVQHQRKRYLEAQALRWERTVFGRYETRLFGVTYELEKRVKNLKDETPDTGWYLYSKNVAGGFFGEFMAATLMAAIDEASEAVYAADLRAEGYEPKADA